ncbi:MAG: trypsin-like peptidase domain-containing protein [Candidatus Woesearchaeota archaeon]
MSKITIHEKILYSIIIVLILFAGYQTYNIYQIKNEILTMDLDLKSHETILSSVQEEIDSVRSQTSTQLSTLTEQLIESSSQISDLRQDLSDVQIESQDFSSIVEEVIESVVSVLTDRSQGSGVFVKRDGYIVTNFHVIENAHRVRVLTYDNKLYDAEIIGVSKSRDIALLKIETNKYPFLKLGDSDEVKVGQRVIAVGNPLGLSFSVTEGIVSATDRVGPNELKAYIQVDVPINPGNSGGPLVNIKKEIIGINNFKIGGFESLGFAIDSNHVQEVIDEIFEELENQ